MFMTPYSYRKNKLFANLALVLLAITVPALAQYAKRDTNVLRGTAVLESASEGWRLTPICIYMGGRFYDADFYQSTPVPMSLIQGTIYEVQKAGEPVGTFSVNDAQRQGAAWYGHGSYKDSVSKPLQEKVSVSASGAVTLKEDKSPDDRPTLKRTKPAPETSNNPEASTPSRDDTQMANNDPDRPTLKRGTQAPIAPVAGPNEDPRTRAELRERTRQMNVAVSDPSQRASRPFSYNWDDQQKQQLTASMTKQAIAELQKVARSRGVTLGPKDNIEFPQVSSQAFDVDFSNNPQLVFTARFFPTTRQLAGLSENNAKEVMRAGIYVTVVARVNYENQLERIFAAVSDPRDLDTYPRMEFVDAVDVDSDDRAELLFAKTNESGRRFSVYRLYGLQMNELFTSGVR
jgi:hypothetical protein